MDHAEKKYGLPVITANMYNANPANYELRKGTHADAPLCPFVNRYNWIGYDKAEMRYVRFTKSVFKKLVRELDNIFISNQET